MTRAVGRMALSAQTAVVLLLCIGTVRAMEVEWTRMTGHWPVESSPLVGDVDGDGTSEILAINRGGQVLLWKVDGSAIGPGEDGMIAQLPAGRWTSTATLTPGKRAARLIVGSVEGLIVALDQKFQVIWKQQLPGTTVWGRCRPVGVASGGELAYCFGDESGAVTLLAQDGSIVWQKNLQSGPCHAPPQASFLPPDKSVLLVPAGSSLHALDTSGALLWKRDLSGDIRSRPEIISTADGSLIVCATQAGSLFGLALTGEVLWRTELGDPIESSIAIRGFGGSTPWIFCTGLWGNLHAIDDDGRRIWTHEYRSKSRAGPLVFDTTNDVDPETVVGTHSQHIYAFDHHGQLVDDVRVNGLPSGGPVVIRDPVVGHDGVLITTASLLAYRLRAGSPVSPYPHADTPGDVQLQVLSNDDGGGPTAVRVSNPNGALINVGVAVVHPEGWSRIRGHLTVASSFEVPVPAVKEWESGVVHADVRDAVGRVITRTDWSLPRPAASLPARQPATKLSAWATPAYGDLREDRLLPSRVETVTAAAHVVTIPSLYIDEVDEGAFIIASSAETPVAVRIECEPPVRDGEGVFEGKVSLRQVIGTPTLNGEVAFDALPTLGEDRRVTLAPHRAAKIWVSVDAHGARSGVYRGRIRLLPVDTADTPAPLDLQIEVLDLTMPRPLPLKLCTWDYVPNRWFPLSVAAAVLDDMNRHGVSIFPRSGCPEGQVDTSGHLTIDWTAFDLELDRLKGRGHILYHLGHPSLKFAPGFAEEKKRSIELAYLHAFRDHLQSHGLSYEDYAFYPVDEPGLDYGKSVQELIDAATLLREADPRMRIYTDPVPTISSKDFERIQPLIDVWCPNMRLVSGLLAHDPRIRRIMDSGHPVWSYECVAQVKSLSPLRYNRANAWRGKYFGLSGIGFWTHSQTQADLWKADPKLKDEFALVYPGDPPVPSVRWEAARDGLEDIGAISLLEQRIQATREKHTRPELIAQAERALRIAKVDVMELSDEAFIESRDFLREGDRRIWHTQTDVDLFRHHRAEIARLTAALSAPTQTSQATDRPLDSGRSSQAPR